MQAIGRQPNPQIRAPDGAPVHYERHRPEQTTLYRLVQQHAATFFEQAESAAGADLPQFVKDEFDAFLECGILAHGFLRLRCGDCGHDKLVAFSCKRRGFCPSCGARRMAQTAAHLVDHVIPRVPVRQWVLSLPIPLRRLLAAQPKLVTPVLQVVHRVITRHLLGQAGLKAEEADSGAVTLIQRFGSAANLNIHLHCLVLDGVYRCDTEGEPVFVEVPAPTDEALQAMLHKIITRLTQAAHPSGGARRRAGSDHHGRQRRRFGRGSRAQAATGRGLHLPHRLRPTRRPESADGAGGHAQGRRPQADAVRRHRWQQSSTPPCAALPTTARRWSSCAATSRARLRTEERVQTNAAGQVVLKLKTAWRDGTTHLLMSPLEFMQQLAAWATEEAPARRPCHAPDCT